MEKDTDLRDEGQWDFDEVVVNPGVQKARAVVSVAFNRDDFETVAKAAEGRDMKTSAFIRDAALAKAAAFLAGATIAGAGYSISMAFKNTTPFTSQIPTDSKTDVEDVDVLEFA